MAGNATQASECQAEEDYYGRSVFPKIRRARAECEAREPPKTFEMTDLATIQGKCVSEAPAHICKAGESSSIQTSTVMEGTPLSGPNLAITREGIHLTVPVNMTVPDRMEPALTFAVCKENVEMICQKITGQDGDMELKCQEQRKVRCVEAITGTQFCDVDNPLAKGYIATRAYGTHTDSQGSVCVYDHCKIPDSWLSQERVKPEPPDWCQFISDGLPSVPSNNLKEHDSAISSAISMVELAAGYDDADQPGVLTLDNDEHQTDEAAASTKPTFDHWSAVVRGTEQATTTKEWMAATEPEPAKAFEAAAAQQKRDLIALQLEQHRVIIYHVFFSRFKCWYLCR